VAYSPRYFSPSYFAQRYFASSGEESLEGFISASVSGSAIASATLRGIAMLSGSTSGIATASGHLSDGLPGDDEESVGGGQIWLSALAFRGVSRVGGCSIVTV
jgi:hypothetical protein